MQHAVVSREDWLAARKALLVKERAITHELDALRAERRNLPWVRVETNYVFEGPQGECTLGGLFDGRSQLAVYHFMLTPGSQHICAGGSFISDHTGLVWPIRWMRSLHRSSTARFHQRDRWIT